MEKFPGRFLPYINLSLRRGEGFRVRREATIYLCLVTTGTDRVAKAVLSESIGEHLLWYLHTTTKREVSINLSIRLRLYSVNQYTSLKKIILQCYVSNNLLIRKLYIGGARNIV
jgi:hypothetical protein